MTVHPSFLDPALPPVEPIEGKTYRADGWIYFDFMNRPYPKYLFDELEAVAGEGNLVYISKLQLGSFGFLALLMVHPDSYERVIAYASQSMEDPVARRTVQ